MIFTVWAPGRPAPQGSKDAQMREQSVYLPSWRAAVKKAVYQEYKALGIKPGDLPLLRGAVTVSRCVFRLDTGQRLDSPPDLDKLIRATFDALTMARLWEDDGRVLAIMHAEKREPSALAGTGVELSVRGEPA